MRWADDITPLTTGDATAGAEGGNCELGRQGGPENFPALKSDFVHLDGSGRNADAGKSGLGRRANHDHIAVQAGVTATVDFLADLSPDNAVDRRTRVLRTMTLVEEHEDGTRALREGTHPDPGAHPLVASTATHADAVPRNRGEQPDRDASVPGRTAGGVSAGIFNAVLASRALDLGSVGGVRVGLSAYNGDDDVDRLP